MTRRVIKRYSNRKLYDVEAKAYVSMADLAALIRGGHTLEVVDNVTGEDITAQTLTQVVLEQGKRGRGVAPTDLLHDLLRRGGRVIDASVDQVRHAADELVQGSIGRLSRVVHAPQERELRQLREQIATLEGTLARLLDERDGVAGRAASRPGKSARKRTTD